MISKVSATPSFQRTVKKLHAPDKLVVDDAIRAIMAQPDVGDAKKGDLLGVLVYKFKLNKQEVLLSYRLQDVEEADELMLLALGSHENFYRDMKR
ncbi:MAG: type II toxin-antitoxin system RelE/ParE family toxin [Burkholderiaceae bacterium]|nr:type II toxin-antitoxin system RelE/ParE family toxin [Burkholderiaceae bacterium]